LPYQQDRPTQAGLPFSHPDDFPPPPSLRERARPRLKRLLGDILFSLYDVKDTEAARLVAGQSVGVAQRTGMHPDPAGADGPGALDSPEQPSTLPLADEPLKLSIQPFSKAKFANFI
jgi:hypothetical protein